jgi:hypothetical protein
VTVAELHLEHVEVVEADASRSTTYVGFPRADVAIMSGMIH